MSYLHEFSNETGRIPFKVLPYVNNPVICIAVFELDSKLSTYTFLRSNYDYVLVYNYRNKYKIFGQNIFRIIVYIYIDKYVQIFNKINVVMSKESSSL